MRHSFLFSLLLLGFLCGSPGFSDIQNNHGLSALGKKEQPRAEDERGSAEKGTVEEVPSDITSLEALRKWLQRFQEEEVVVKMGATWCGPCRDVAPLIEKLAERKAGKIKVVTIDIDQNPTLAKILSPRGMVPALVTIKNDGKSAPSAPMIGYSGASKPSAIGKWLREQQ